MPTPEVIVDFEPDWNSPPEVSYAFQSVVQSTPRFVEQRRPLLPSPIRGMKCTYTLEDEEAQRLVNVLSHGASKFLGVPVYSEPLIPTSLDQGASVISVAEDISYLWNIQNCLYAIVIDFVSHASEILQVLSAYSTTILLSESISGSYTPANCVVYPAFVGVVKAFDKQPVTDLLFSIAAEFEETSSEHSEASGAWSGLEERVCPEDLIAGSTSPSASISPSPAWADIPFNGFTVTDSPSGEITVTETIANIVNTGGDVSYARKTQSFASSGSIRFRFGLMIHSIGSMSSSTRNLKLINFAFGSPPSVFTWLVHLWLDDGPPNYQFKIGALGEASGYVYTPSSLPLTRYIQLTHTPATSKILLEIFTDDEFLNLEHSEEVTDGDFASNIEGIECLLNYNSFGATFTVTLSNLEYMES